MLRMSLYQNSSYIKVNLFQYLVFLKKNPFTTFFPAFHLQHFSEHMLMVASVNKTLEGEINKDTSFHFFYNCFNKTNF